MMKHSIKILSGLLILLLSSSCNKFLTVNPKTEVSRDALLSTEAGFKDAVTGVYIQMGEDVSYGKTLTMTSIEHLVSSWEVSAQTPAGRLGQFDYSDAGVEAVLENIFNNQYRTVASINAILSEIDHKKAIFSPGMYELIKGECLALRGLLHFDMLRLFGPVPTQSVSTLRLPPYVTAFSKTPSVPVSFSGFKTALFTDLEEAEQLLAISDPFLSYSISDFKNGTYRTNDNFVNHRYLRMNYYAVKALKARAYLWFNESQKAYQEAVFVISAKNPDGTFKFKLGEASDFSANNYVLTNEQIFGLYDHNINTKFTTPTLYKGTDRTIVNNQLYTDNLGTDIRQIALWEETVESSVSRYIFKKYQFTNSSSNLLSDFKQIPMLRLSEMYLIAMETGDPAEATIFWEEFRDKRGLAQTLPPDVLQKRALLLKEYRKEFYGEGQAFYAYKRLNAPAEQIIFLPAGVEVNYTPPLPKSEITIN